MKKFNFNYVILIFLVAFNLRLGISSVPPIQTIIQEALRLSNFQVSLLVGIPVVCMGIFAFLVSKVQAKFGRQKSILWLLILLGISTIGRLFVTGYVFLLITTFCIGFAIAIIGPLLSGFIKEEFSEYSSILVGVYSFAMGVGSLIVSSFTKLFIQIVTHFYFIKQIQVLFDLLLILLKFHLRILSYHYKNIFLQFLLLH